MVKRFILNAENVGSSEAINTAVIEGFEGGLLKSVAIDPLGKFFDEAVEKVIPGLEGLGVGVQLNLTGEKHICSDLNELKPKETYFSLLLKCLKPKNKAFTEELEREIRRQIEKVMGKTKVSFIASKDHIHSIPFIFNLVCRLAKEYQIPQVRTHFENFYFVPELFRHLHRGFLKNFIKKFLLNFLSVFNENTIHKYGLETNDYLIGISYADSMDGMSIYYGIKNLTGKNQTTEVIISPCRYEDGTINQHFDEYMITKNKRLKSKIEKMGYEITNYVKEEQKEAENN